MNDTRALIFDKSISSSTESSDDPQEAAYNITTMEALQEASNIMSGNKKVNWNRFQPGIAKVEAAKELKKTLGS